jgi:16S rRNA (adenine1518-N6/adenine1519-N6)-dimethyltransferase
MNTLEVSLQREILDTLDLHGIVLDTDHKDQHLLVSPEAINKLVDSAKITSKDVIIEIGPGPGQITERLCQTNALIRAIEIDTRFEPILSVLCAKYNNLEIIYDDVMDVPWRGATKIVANPPFSILEPLIMRLTQEKRILSTHFVIGQRYYERCAAPSEHMTKTSLITKGFFEIAKVDELAKTDFFPTSREHAVIMSLIRANKKNTDFSLRMLASRVINMPNESVSGFLRNLLGELINVKTTDYRAIPSVKSLNIPDSTGRKRLGEIDNKDITVLVRAIGMLKKNFRHL